MLAHVAGARRRPRLDLVRGLTPIPESPKPLGLGIDSCSGTDVYRPPTLDVFASRQTQPGMAFHRLTHGWPGRPGFAGCENAKLFLVPATLYVLPPQSVESWGPWLWSEERWVSKTAEHVSKDARGPGGQTQARRERVVVICGYCISFIVRVALGAGTGSTREWPAHTRSARAVIISSTKYRHGKARPMPAAPEVSINIKPR